MPIARTRAFHDYSRGLLLLGERKSVEPMAAVMAPDRVSAKHQSLLHFVGQADWSDAKVLAKMRELVVPALERSGGIEAWIVDDSGIPRRACIRSAWPGNIAAAWASRTTARWR